jgi:hypothetical protein
MGMLRELVLPAALLLPLASGVRQTSLDHQLSKLQAKLSGAENSSFIVTGGVEDKVTPDMCVTQHNPKPINVKTAWTEGGAHCWPTTFIIGVQKAATTSVGNALHQCGLASMAYSSKKFSRCPKDVVCKETLHAPLDIRTSKGQQEFTGLYASSYCCNPNSNLPCPDPRPRKACETAHFISAQPLRVVLRLKKTEYEPYAVALGGDSNTLAPVDEFDDYDDPESSNNIANVVNALPHHLLPIVKFVLILREPVSRMLSWYNHELEDAEASSSVQRRNPASQQTFDEYARMAVAPRSSWTDFNGVNDISDKSKGDLEIFKKVIMRRSNVTRFPAQSQGLRSVPSLPCDQPTFTKGVYLPFLTFFNLHSKLKRNQLMVVNMDTLIEKPKDMFKRITTHYGLPVLTHMHRLIKTNERDTLDRVVQPRCTTRDFLSAAYRPFNEKLYAQLKKDQDLGIAPSNEVEFRPFNVVKSVPCTHGAKALTARMLGHHGLEADADAPSEEEPEEEEIDEAQEEEEKEAQEADDEEATDEDATDEDATDEGEDADDDDEDEDEGETPETYEVPEMDEDAQSDDIAPLPNADPNEIGPLAP